MNGGFEGKGKHIFPNGNYYIGQYKGSMQNGKGILYYKNGKNKNMKEILKIMYLMEMGNIYERMGVIILAHG